MTRKRERGRWRRTLLGCALTSACAFSFSAVGAQQPPFEAGYSTGPNDDFDVYYICSDRRPYEGKERCPGDDRTVIRVADITLYRKH